MEVHCEPFIGIQYCLQPWLWFLQERAEHRGREKGQQALTFEVDDRVAAEDLELERMAAGSGDDRRYKRHRLVR